MKTDFQFPAIGWHVGLSERAKNEIAQRLPKKLEPDKISDEVGYYVIARDGAKKNPSPEDARKDLQTFRDRARKLRETALAIEHSPTARLIKQAAVLTGVSVDVGNLQEALLRLDKAVSKAMTFLPKGRRVSPREKLVSSLARILKKSGVAVSARPKGALCHLIEIVLDDIGEQSSDVRKLVQPILRRLENSSK